MTGMARRSRVFLVASAFLLLLTGSLAHAGCRAHPPAPVTAPAFALAQRLDGGKDLPNLGRMAEGFFRGAQPTEAGLDRLKTMGVRTVVNLRHFHGDSEEKYCRAKGMDYVQIHMDASDIPTAEQVAAFLAVVRDPARR